MKFANLLTKFYFEPWGIRPDKHAAMGVALDRYLKNPKGWMEETESDESHVPASPLTVINGIGVISINGVLGKRLSMLEMMCGGCDYDVISEAIKAARSDAGVREVIFDINSPGGQVVGCRETAALMAQLSQEKPTYAWTELQACSCAYWLASACSEIHCTPSANVGAIGVYIAAIDDSRSWEIEGLRRELFRSGKLKAIGLSGKEWTDDEREFLQGRVEKQGEQFRSVVRAARPGVAPETMEGQWFDGDEAVALGLADATAMQMEDLVAAILANR